MNTREIYSGLIKKISGYNYFKELVKLLESGVREVSLKYLAGSFVSLSIAALHRFSGRNIFVLVPEISLAEVIYNDIRTAIGDEEIILISEPTRRTRFQFDNNRDGIEWQIECAVQLSMKDKAICISTKEIFNNSLPHPAIVKQNIRRYKAGDTLNMNEYVMQLLLSGFEKVDYVSKAGELSVRGGILDIFPAGLDNPLRFDFLGEEIESIREFELLSQRSIRRLESVEFIAKVFYEDDKQEQSDIISYLRDETLFVIIEPDRVLEDNISNERIKNFSKILINKIGQADIEIKSVSQPSFSASIHRFGSELKEMINSKQDIYISSDGEIHLKRLRALIENYFYDINYEGGNKIDDENYKDIKISKLVESIKWLDESLSEGFYFPGSSLVFLTEHQIFNRHKFTKSRRKSGQHSITLRQLRQLQTGDFIVHEDKGIGLFDGFKTVELGGSKQECIKILYADGDNLYVNLNYIHKIQPYTASEGITPKITKLGSGEWLRKKNRTKSKLKDIARDLIRLYAERKLQEGISYPSDTIWQKELEASFVYEDTPDQALTTQDVKNDMERPTPMDRLVCGDVGFGKTEVAIRAAFKAAQSGKQVAVLVPTTILAQQHYMTFTDRLKNYPIITEILSRFKNKSEQRKILDKLERGSIDIIIGTHRLLSEDVKFKDLGLLIIDEEHRFGVGAKEKLRRLRSNVDTLAMTATPIPRTLNFSMIGARDISNIETPPRNRLPVYTEILEWNLELIKAFIEKEISRGGQVFFVNDNIEGLEKIGRDIKMLIPGLKVGIAHGQMKTRELEDVMSRFISGKYEVLVTTKIIESGIDIPNANTMIINRADNFGLAELYQLRGRVGRTNKQAYCYLIIPQMKRLSGKTLRRLQAIEEFTELGSGFRLALRDLEIRGAGNLLGPEQSGYINEIGFDLYHKILDEALQELRFEEFGELFDLESHKRAIAISNDDVEIDLAGVAMFPESYIKSESERFYYYKRLYEMRTNEDLYQIVDEITDKYGALPDEARELIYAVKVRMAALDTGLRKVIIKGENLIAEFPQSDNKEFYEMTLPVIIEFINDSEICKLKQIKKKVFLEARINNRDEAIELLWRLKRTISIN